MEVLPKRWILLIVLLATLSSLSTTDAQTDRKNDTIGRSYITVNLLAPLDIYLPRWRAGYIKKINRKWKIGIDVGYGNGDITLLPDLPGEMGSDYRIWEIRPELYFILNPERKGENYVSVELFYVHHKDVFDGGHYFPVNGYSQRYDRTNFRRQKYGINVIHGFLIYSKWRIGVNGYLGVGLKIRDNTFSDVRNSQDVDLGPEGGDMFGMMDYKNVEGVNVGVNPVFGIKFYYKLND